MAKSTRNPWSEIQGMKNRVDRIMEDMFEQSGPRERPGQRSGVWQPVADVCETDAAYCIQLELAGMERDKVELEVHGRELWVYGERRLEKDASGGTFHALERSYGPFARQFLLPEEIDKEGIRARMRNGLLTITIPKKGPTEKEQRISIIVE